MHDFGGDLSKRWYIDFYVNGSRSRKWIASNPAETRPARARKEFQKINKKFGDNYSDTLKALLEKLKLRDKTKVTYRTDINILYAFCPELSKIDPLAFHDYLTENYSQKTCRNKINNLKAVFAEALKRKIVKINPFLGLKAQAYIDESDFNFPYSDFERSIIEPYLQEHYPRLYLFTRFIYYTFSRPKELLGLKVQNIDLRTRTIKIPAEISKTGKPLVKPISKNMLDLILQNRILHNPGHYYIFGKNLETRSEKSGINTPNNLHRQALKELNIYRENETVLYSWKHTGNINAYLKGMDIKLIQTINGHTSVATTEIYLKKLGLFLNKEAFDFEF